MSFDTKGMLVIGVMTIAAAACRLAGYGFMRFIPITPRLEAALRAIPIAVMIGIIGPPILKGGVPEIAGLIATMMAVRLGGNDLVAITAGMGAVAGMRLAF